MPAGETPLKFGGFVGRERELAELRHALDETREGHGRLFLVSGEPGIGKSRLAEEVAREAAALGMRGLWGRCWEGDGAPAYWPWLQVIRSFLGALDPERRRNLEVESEIASDMIHQVAQIVPDLRPAKSILQPPVTANVDPNEACFRLFDAVTNFLKMGARTHPMLIVLDDLHDADEASLALLRFMARELRGASMMIVATYRDLEVRRSPSLSKLIGEVSRDAGSMPMSGLSEPEVSRFIELRAEQTPDEGLVAKLCAATDGNPLFVDGIVRSLIAEGAIGSAGAMDRPFKIPSGVREAIRSRLDALSPESNSILAATAAIGNEFDFNLCQSVAAVSPDEAHRLLDEASSAGIVTAFGRGRYRFSHALLREAVYEELDTNTRIQIHGKIANRIEEIHREDIDPHLAALAHHFRVAGVAEKAIDYSVRAGQAAVSVLAFTDAMVHLAAALELMEQFGSEPRRRADLLGLLGRVAFEIDPAKSVNYRESAIVLYDSTGCYDEAAHIRVTLGRSLTISGQPIVNGARAIEHLRRAESVLAKGPETIELARLYEGIAAYESQRMDLVQSARAAGRTMEISDRVGNKAVWADAAAFFAYTLAMSGQLKQGFVLLDQAFDAAEQANAPAAGLVVARIAGSCCTWLGDPRGARAWWERELNKPRNARLPFTRRELSQSVNHTYLDEGQPGEAGHRFGAEYWAIRFWVAGEWEAVAALNESSAAASERADDQFSRLNWSITLGATYLLLGEYARAESHLLYGLDNGDRGPLVLQEMRARPWLARVYLAMNRLDVAAEQVARCRQIMADGEDWRGRAGDVALAEAVVAATRGNYDIADRQFESALAIHQKYHLGWALADTLHCWGRALAAAGDRRRAAEKFDAAIENHRSRGVGPRLIEWLTDEKVSALSRASQSPRVESKLIGTFRREGEFWTISYRDTTFRLKDAKGLRYIAYLLAHPGQRIHVYDLIEAVDGSAFNDRTKIHTGSEDLAIVREIDAPGPTIDARARSEYRARLHDLQAELDEAERANDLGRSQQLRGEIEIVGQQLAGSSRLGGRARTASGSAERARGLVGKNIRSGLERIRGQHPALGRHLATTIRTGYFCVYQPEPDHPVSWQF